MRVLRNTGQNISPSDDGRLFDQAFTDGMFNSPSITSLGADQVQIGAMYGILCGRDFTSDAQQVSVALSDSGTKTGHIYIRFDTTTADIISIESVIGTFTPTYQDINTTGTVAEMEIATYTATELAVTSLTPNYPKAQTEPNEAIAGSLATIETNPATANHAVGTYIVYDGQLYKVTTAITAGTTLNGKISAVSVGNEINNMSAHLSLDSFRVDGIATGASAGGFKITHNSNTTFVMLYMDTFGRHTLLRKTSNSVATSTVITGPDYSSTSFTSTETKLKVNPYTRAGFFIISGQMSDIAISTYTE